MMEVEDRDEVLSWRASTVIMVLAASATLASRLLGTDPFTWIFDVLIVYIPTIVLVGVALLMMTKRWIRVTAKSTLDQPKAEHTAA
jgi:TRAP-type C4-dicarboxylate transport system permease small subunit